MRMHHTQIELNSCLRLNYANSKTRGSHRQVLLVNAPPVNVKYYFTSAVTRRKLAREFLGSHLHPLILSGTAER
jgi:hypothetical protein